jgi:hypothetical protein
MSIVDSLLTSFLLSGLWLTLIGFLGKSLIANFLAKDIELFKGNIAVKNIERQIILARLHEKRADAISSIYQSLLEYHANCRKFIYEAEHVDEDTRQVLLRGINDTSNNFTDIFQKNHLYLSVSLCEKIERTFRTAQIPAHRFIYALGSYLHSEKLTQEQYTGEWKKAFEAFADGLPPLLKQLENEFRSLLGVEE